jgi:hypothetical protein
VVDLRRDAELAKCSTLRLVPCSEEHDALTHIGRHGDVIALLQIPKIFLRSASVIALTPATATESAMSAANATQYSDRLIMEGFYTQSADDGGSTVRE